MDPGRTIRTRRRTQLQEAGKFYLYGLRPADVHRDAAHPPMPVGGYNHSTREDTSAPATITVAHSVFRIESAVQCGILPVAKPLWMEARLIVAAATSAQPSHKGLAPGANMHHSGARSRCNPHISLSAFLASTPLSGFHFIYVAFRVSR